MNCNLQPVLACIIIAVLCVLAAMQVLSQCCTLSPSSSSEWSCVVATVVLFALVFAYLCKRTAYNANANKNDANDTFANFATHNWGAPNEPALTRNAAEFETEHTSKIAGPTPDGDLRTWQYNPQNTLVDYEFYEVPANGDAPVRISPLADGSVGKRNQPVDQLAGRGQCNNNPAQQTYAVKNPASSKFVPTGTVSYNAELATV